MVSALAAHAQDCDWVDRFPAILAARRLKTASFLIGGAAVVVRHVSQGQATDVVLPSTFLANAFIERIIADKRRRFVTSSAVSRPCLNAFRFPFGAPGQ